MIEFKVGILGAGHIGGVIADTLHKLDGFTPYAVASRDKEKAIAFGTDHNIKVCYGSYDELLNDPEVELVYIATVNSTHAELAKKCIEAGKPALVEKPFSYNAVTAAEVFKLADEKKVFCGEAMWLRYTHMMNLLVEIIRKGIIGDVRTVIASLGYNLRDVKRLTSMETAGGALLDLGVYPLTMAFMIMGAPPVSVASSYVKMTTGVDAYSSIQMSFPGGKFANIITSMISEYDNRCTIYGTNGRIEIEGVTCPNRIIVYGPDGKQIQELNPSEKYINGYEYEFLAAREAIIVGRPETPQNTRAHIMALYSFTDTIRKTWDIIYPLPGEETVAAKRPEVKKV
ncbi:MAG: Gfo/Idh/MocA family oxidoreductase [Eubacterium sp.]|nr:Gfo/Idh/MocA family oxidoreductase [Eubacterium sp.]